MVYVFHQRKRMYLSLQLNKAHLIVQYLKKKKNVIAKGHGK